MLSDAILNTSLNTFSTAVLVMLSVELVRCSALYQFKSFPGYDLTPQLVWCSANVDLKERTFSKQWSHHE